MSSASSHNFRLTFCTTAADPKDDVLAVAIPVVDLHNPIDNFRADVKAGVISVRIDFRGLNISEARDVERRVRTAVRRKFSADSFSVRVR